MPLTRVYKGREGYLTPFRGKGERSVFINDYNGLVDLVLQCGYLTKEGASALKQFASWVMRPPECLLRDDIVHVWKPSRGTFVVEVSSILVDSGQGTVLKPNIIVNF